MSKITAVYVRVSTVGQNLENQLPDLRRWAQANGVDTPGDDGWLDKLTPRHVGNAVWYPDKFTGLTQERPGWKRLMEAFEAGKVDRIVVWRLDRLARRASGMTALFDRCIDRGVSLVSVRESFDLSTPAGRLFATMLAGFAQFECESMKERQRARIELVRWQQGKAHELKAEGLSVETIAVRLRLTPERVHKMLTKPPGRLWYGGRRPGDGRIKTCTADRVRELHSKGLTVDEIAAATGAHKRTVFRRLKTESSHV